MKICSIEGCSNKHIAKGYCQKHYTKLRKYGNPLFSKRHGMGKTPIYEVWRALKQRCTNPNYPKYKDYGGRGITVCDRWLDFRNFYADMGDIPFDGARIDRRENDKGYSKDNCRWVTVVENNRNTRANVLNMFTARSIRRLYAMKKYTINQLCLIYNLKRSTLESVIYNYHWKEV